MYVYLANQSYLTSLYIIFGRGTGTLDPARVEVFNKIAGAAVTFVSADRKLPVSSITFKTVLNADQYVGETITEVGLSSSNYGSGLCTHALLKDAEGNTISIAKTNTDIITIYATVYFNWGSDVYLQPPGTKGGIYINPTGGLFQNYFAGGTFYSGSSQYSRMYMGSVDAPLFNVNGQGGDQLFYLNSQNSVQYHYIKDTTNKRITFKPPVLQPAEGNGPIRRIAVGDQTGYGFTFVFPIQGVFEAYDIMNEVLGTGNGTRKAFDFKWDGIKPDTQVIKINDVVADPSTYKVAPKLGGIKMNIAMLSSSGWANGYTYKHVSFSADGKIGLEARTGTSNQSSTALAVHRINPADGTSAGGNDNQFYNFGGVAAAYFLADDKNIIVVGSNGSFYVYEVSKVDGKQIGTTVTTAIGTGAGYGQVHTAVITKDKSRIVTLAAGKLFVHKLEVPGGGDRPAPTLMNEYAGKVIPSTVDCRLVLSPDEKFLYQVFEDGGVSTNATYTKVFPFNKDTGEIGLEVVRPAPMNGIWYFADFSPDGKYVSIVGKDAAGVSVTALYVYDPVTGLPGQKITLPGGELDKSKGIIVSPNSHTVISFVQGGGHYEWALDPVTNTVNDVPRKRLTTSDMGTRFLRGYMWNAAGSMIIYAINSGNFCSAYYEDGGGDNITFNTAPALDAAIKADYTIPYIPKDDQHIFEFGFSVQFGPSV
jgi:hypothetical protein